MLAHPIPIPLAAVCEEKNPRSIQSNPGIVIDKANFF